MRHPPSPLTLREGGMVYAPFAKPKKTDDRGANERSDVSGGCAGRCGGRQASIPLAPLRSAKGEIPRSARNDMGVNAKEGREVPPPSRSPKRPTTGARTSGAERTDTRAGDARGGVGAGRQASKHPPSPLTLTRRGEIPRYARNDREYAKGGECKPPYALRRGEAVSIPRSWLTTSASALML